MSDVLTDAQKLYREALDAMLDQRRQIEEDLKFSDPSDPQQWDSVVKLQRESDPGGKRPCLVHDQLGQYVANVAGQIEQRPPSLHAIPVGGGADKQAAEQIDGRFRHIEHASRATQHYARALTSAARTGVGYVTIRPEYIDRALNWQEPRLGSEPDPLKVVLDPWSVETDGSDATFGFLLKPLSEREFKRQWPKAEAISFDDDGQSSRKERRESILIVEQFWQEEMSQKMIVYRDEDGQEQTTDVTPEEFQTQMQMSGAGIQYLRDYTEKKLAIKWRRMNGVEVLEESEYPADGIGIVPVYGYVGFADGRMRYCGIPRRGRAPQQAYNYHISEQLAYIGTAPRAPWLVSKRAAAGVEPLWDKAASEARGWLPYNDFDSDGVISPPTRINAGSNIVNHEQGAEQSLKDIQASIGMYQANLGAQSNETSGVAIENRKQQGEASTAHFPSHMAASLGQVGKIVMQMDAKLADTKRKQPIIGVDGSAGSVTVDPAQKQAFQRGPDGVTINPKVGDYGVRVVVGASYSTQRTQTNAAFAEIMRGNQELAPVVAPFWAQTLDFPGSDKFAQAMAAMAPAPVKAILQPEDGQDAPDPAALAQQLDQCKQALQEAIAHAHEAQDDADKAIQALSDKSKEEDTAKYEAETNRLKVTGANEDQIKAIVADLINTMLSSPQQLPGDAAPPQGGDLQQASTDASQVQQADQAPVAPTEPQGAPV